MPHQVSEVYRAIFPEADASVSTLQMLTNIEAQLEELLGQIETMPQEEVEIAERAKEKERRTRAREIKQELAIKAQEERIQRSIRRAQSWMSARRTMPLT